MTSVLEGFVHCDDIWAKSHPSNLSMARASAIYVAAMGTALQSSLVSRLICSSMHGITEYYHSVTH